MECSCPKPAALTTIPKQTCPENIGQIQKILFQRAGWTFDSEADPTTDWTLLASWTPLLTAVGDTKVVVTPWLENVVIGRAEAITEGGGDNTTLNGRQITVGAGNIPMTGDFRMVASAIVEAMKALQCEGEELVMYFINEFDQLVGRNISSPISPVEKVTGIPVYSLFVSDMDNNGKNTQDKGGFSAQLDYGWRKDLIIVKPAFSPKASLVVA